MSLATAATYRNEFKNKALQPSTSINNKHLHSSNVHAKGHIAFALYTPQSDRKY